MRQRRPVRGLLNMFLIGTCLFSILSLPPNQTVKASPNLYTNNYVVNSNSDLDDNNPGDYVCQTSVGGPCSLRAAITEANADLGDVGISFSGDMSITLGNTLRILTTNVGIDGGGYAVTISGAGIPTGGPATGECLRIAGDYIWFGYLTIRDCPTYGIWVGEYASNGGGDHNTIYAVNLLGNPAAGIIFIDEDSDGSGGNNNTLDYSLIGANSYSPSSCIVANSNGYGVILSNLAFSNSIQHTSIFCNDADGVYSYSAYSNVIHGNAIAGNLGDGINLFNSHNTNITENFIGNLEGILAFANGTNGVRIGGGSYSINVGGLAQTDGNVISGNANSGIFITGNSYHIAINNNVIGANASYDGAIGNWHAGIAISDNNIPGDLANAVMIGDDEYITRHQYISGNDREGIWIYNSNNVRILDSNLIGRGSFSANPEVRLGNLREGIMIVESHDILVGGYAIQYNGMAGVAVEGDLSQSVLIHPQRDYANGGLAIDLRNDGFTPNDLNDSDSGPNTVLNYPEVTSVSGGVASGYACYPDCRVYFFKAMGDPSKPGGGFIDQGLGSANTDEYTGIWSMTLTHPITYYALMTVHVPTGTTSELRPVPKTFIPLIKRP